MGKEKTHYRAPSAELIPSEMARFFDWVNGKTAIDPVLKAAVAHLWFVTIHPFDDGNGRIARAITDLLMTRADESDLRFYSMSNIICLYRKDYYTILEKTQHGVGDITQWLLWFVYSLEEAVQSSNSTLQTILDKGYFWEQHRDTTLNVRQQKIINMLLDGFDGQMNTGHWSRICKCSRDTALNDATDLIAKGILKRGEAGGHSTFYVLNRQDG